MQLSCVSESMISMQALSDAYCCTVPARRCGCMYSSAACGSLLSVSQRRKFVTCLHADLECLYGQENT